MADHPAINGFEYVSGNNPIRELEQRLDQIATFLSGSVLSNAPAYNTTTQKVVTFTTVDPLPTGTSVATGSIAFSGSGAATRMYIYTGNGNANGNAGWQTASFGG